MTAHDKVSNPSYPPILSPLLSNHSPSNPTVKSDPPFRISEEGWGEFEMRINLFTIDSGKEHSFVHDLNFATPRYDIKHVVAFKKPTPAQLAALRMSGPIPGDHQPQDGMRKKSTMTAGDDTPSGLGTPGGGGFGGPVGGGGGGSGGGGLMTPSGISSSSAVGKKRKSGLGGRDKLVRSLLNPNPSATPYQIPKTLTLPPMKRIGNPRTPRRRNQTNQRQRHVRADRDNQR